MRSRLRATFAVISGSMPKRFDSSGIARSASRDERLVARLHVGEVRVVEHVREQRQEVVRQRVPEVEHLALFARETAAEDHIRLAVEDRPQHPRIIVRIVLEIGVLKDGEVAGHLRDRAAQGRAFAHDSAAAGKCGSPDARRRVPARRARCRPSSRHSRARSRAPSPPAAAQRARPPGSARSVSSSL